ncbi:hypothetical protein [Lederbergia citri]|uniref:Phage structural protein n=1 Tax=Lederbergia citri TaxID=2833580 RepID=A0A942TF74_9BACI|nr:hypothetical protein [Lederbergia citri]MBS4195324.1 hypothetical protein [Lederbergia citri]
MAEISKFFNAVLVDGKYDREYFASDFAEYFGDVLSSGLLLDENEQYGLQVTTGTGLQTVVANGKALIKGYSYKNTTPKELVHSLPEATNDRIDRIVLRWDSRNQGREIKTLVKEGMPSATPEVPALQRDKYIYELGLAQVIVRANTASIDANDITDERALEDVCGIVQSLITVPTSVFQQQFDAWFNSRKDYYESIMSDWQTQEQADFDAWFQSIKDVLDGDIATNLASRITAVEQDLMTHKAEKGTLEQEGHVQLSNDLSSVNDTMAVTPNGARKRVEQTDFKVYKSGKDANGIFTTIEYKRQDNTLAIKSVLSGGISPKYTKRTITYYGTDGTTVEKTTTRTVSYDADDVWISEV